MNYFTSDLHLGHRNIIRLCNRPFATIEEMDETLIRNWNAKVTNGDTVYILGDLLFRNEKPAEEYLKQLKGKKHPIIGNHDRDWVKKCNLEDFFESVNNLHFISDGKRQMTLCHYRNMHPLYPVQSKKNSPPPMKGTKRYRKEQKRAAKKARRQSIAHVLTLIENLDTQARVARSM